MNKEIKEILDRLKYSIDNPISTEVDPFTEEAYDYPNFFYLDSTTDECKILLDYIINLQLQLEDKAYEQLKVSHKKLQQENKNLKIQLKGTTHCYDEEEHKRLQQENEKFRVYLKPKYIVDKIKKLEEENEKLRIDISARETVCNDYKSRNEKAIEYINFLQIDTPEGFVPFNKCIWGEELLELLQGSDNNE